MSEHTKGPWEAVKGLKPNETRIWAEDAPCSRIAVVFHRCILDTRGGRGKAGNALPHEANARLIVAAPALLAAAKATLYRMTGGLEGKRLAGESGLGDDIFPDFLRATIAQAEEE